MSSAPAPLAPPSCACTKPAPACVCDRLEVQACGRGVLVLQHPQEADALLGTVPLLAATVAAARVRVGLSWPNLAAALGAPEPGWAVVYPGLAADSAAPDHGRDACDQLVLRGPRGQRLPPRAVRGIVLLDGSWSQAKALWWRNPWLLKLARISLFPQVPCMYGRLRRAPRPTSLSTLEAAALALEALGEPPALAVGLRRSMRTLLQRVRAGNPLRT